MRARKLNLFRTWADLSKTTPEGRAQLGSRGILVLFLLRNTSYPDHIRISQGNSKERSLSVPPQLGQVIGCQGSRSVLGKTTLKP